MILDSIVRFSIRNRGSIIVLSLLLLIYAALVTARSPLDVFPEFAAPYIVVQTESPGFSPGQVEQLVTRPIETSLSGIAGLNTLRSQSIQGLSVVTAIFKENTDVFRNRQLVAERLTEVGRALPQSVRAPLMAPLTSSTGVVLVSGLVSDQLNPRQLRTLAEYEVKLRLLAIPGVARVVVFGGELKQLQIQLDPKKLRQYGMSFDDVVKAAANVTGVRGAGFIENDQQRIVLETFGQLLAAGQLADAVVRRTQGIDVRLKDLGHVVEGAEPKYGDAQVNAKSGILVEVSGGYGINTPEVTRAVEQELQSLDGVLKSQKVQLIPNIFRPAGFIETALHNVRSSLLIGGILVIAVLFLFLWNARTSLISLTAIPLSLLLATLSLVFTGISLNTMTLGGLAIAIGEVVDDAVIDVENILRRLKQNAGSPHPQPHLRVVFEASVEVRHAVVYATFIVVLVFVPVINMGGLQGRLFAPLGYAYIFSILASLAVALTLTPALCASLLTGKALRSDEPRGVKRLKGAYERRLSSVMRKPRWVILASAALILSAVAMVPFFQGSFLPQFQEGHFIVHMNEAAGTSLRESIRIGKQVTEQMLRVPGVRAVGQFAGREALAEDTWGPNYSEFHVDLVPLDQKRTAEVQAKIQEIFAHVPGIEFDIKTYLMERIEETISGATAEVDVNLFGEDLNGLDKVVPKVEKLLSETPGATNVRLESQLSTPEIMIVLKPRDLARRGLDAGLVLDAIQTAYQGSVVNQVYEQNRSFNVAVTLDPAVRQNPDAIGDLPLKNPDGAWFRLRDIAELKMTTGRYSIFHENTGRREAVLCDVENRDLASFSAEVERKLQESGALPPGVTAKVSGTSQAKAQAQKQLTIQAIFAAAGILLLLWSVLRSGKNLALVLTNLPFAFVGGVLAVLITGRMLNLGSLVGFVSLFGISTRNSLMLVTHYAHLVKSEGAVWGHDTAVRGASERLLPILMTASVTALGLLPIAIGSGDPGREIEGPMATVILGGLFTSTALNLLVLPTLALRFGRFTST